MSAAEPATPPTPPAVNGRGDAAVVSITDRARMGPDSRSQGRWKLVGNTAPGPGPGQEQPTLTELAEHIETTFNQLPRGLTLTDDDTAAAYTATLGIVRGMLEGAQERGVVDEAQRAELDALIEGMLPVPDLL